MFQKCFLHVGNPHAGSTSIQGALFDHAAQLREEGFLYPSSHRNHGALAADKAPQSRRAQAILTREQRAAEPDADLDDICRAFRAEVEAEMAASDAHTLLLSSEFFCTLPVEELQALQQYLSRFAEQVVVVCYTRHPYAEYLTRIQHRVKRGRGRIEQFSRESIQGNIVDRLDKLVEAYGREHVMFRPFERPQLYQNDVVADFLHLAGASDALIARIEATELNVSPSHEAIMLADALVGLNAGQRRRGGPDATESRVLSMLASRVRGTKFGFDTNSTQALLDDARPQAERLRAEYGLALSEPAVPAPGARWSQETLTDLVEVIWELANTGPRRGRWRALAAEAGEEPARRGRGGRRPGRGGGKGPRGRGPGQGRRKPPEIPGEDNDN